MAKCEGYYDDVAWFKEMRYGASEFRYSTNWSHGGPIIEREKIAIEVGGIGWQATNILFDEHSCRHNGPTPLIAAMRCYVASKLGDEAEVPEELL